MSDKPQSDSLRALATQIARDLFTNGNGQHAARLVLEGATRIDGGLGGWCESAVADRIAEWLASGAARDPVGPTGDESA